MASATSKLHDHKQVPAFSGPVSLLVKWEDHPTLITFLKGSGVAGRDVTTPWTCPHVHGSDGVRSREGRGLWPALGLRGRAGCLQSQPPCVWRALTRAPGSLPVQLQELLLRAMGPQRGLGRPPLQLEQPQAQAAVRRARVPALGGARRRRRQRPGLRGRPGRGSPTIRAPARPARSPRASWSPPAAPPPPPPPDTVPRHQRLGGPGRADAHRGRPPPCGLEGGGSSARARGLQWQDAQHRQGRLHQDGRPPVSWRGRR